MVQAMPATRSRVLLAVCLLLVLHGSLYPWRFDFTESLANGWAEMWAQAGWWTSLGDVAGNVVLFVPVGWLATRAWPARPGRSKASAIAILLAGVAYALAIQVLQIWVPARSASLADVLWNTVGLVLGQIAALLRARLFPVAPRAAAPTLGPGWLIALLWLAIEWWPFLPTIDFQQIKNALKPLLLAPQWHTRSFIAVTLSVMVVAQMARAWPRRALLLFALVAAAALGKLFLRGQAISLPHAAGWIAGLALALALLWRLGGTKGDALVLALALGFFTYEELRPFSWDGMPSAFSWIPFVSSLRGSMVVNTLALCWQMFWLGAVMLAGRALGWRIGPLAIALAGWAFALEWQQAWLPGRVADITPAVLPLLWWLAMPAAPARR